MAVTLNHRLKPQCLLLMQGVGVPGCAAALLQRACTEEEMRLEGAQIAGLMLSRGDLTGLLRTQGRLL